MKQGAKTDQKPKRRGTETRRATKLIAFRVTPAEAESLRVAAEEAGQSVAAYVRSKAVQASQIVPRRGKPPVEAVRRAGALAALGKVGGNLRQLIRAVEGRADIPLDEARAALEAVQRMRAELADVGVGVVDQERLGRVLADLGSVGDNLNTQARAANRGREVAADVALAGFQAVQRIRAEVRALLGLGPV